MTDRDDIQAKIRDLIDLQTAVPSRMFWVLPAM